MSAALSNVLPDWMVVLQKPLVGENQGKHVARIVRACVGLSLRNHADQLGQLFLINERPELAKAVSGIKTNCGTFMRCAYALAGCSDTFVTREYQGGMAVTWDLQAAADENMLLGAHETIYSIVFQTPNGEVLDGYMYRSEESAKKAIKDNEWVNATIVKREAWQYIDEGWGLHYSNIGYNNDHMEFALSKPDLKTGEAEHAGGGREDNAITKTTGNILFSLGRPLQHIICPDGMAKALERTLQDAPYKPYTPQDFGPLAPAESPPPKAQPKSHRAALTAMLGWMYVAYDHHKVAIGIAIALTLIAGLVVVYEEAWHKKHTDNPK
jgi:hypothetical protein